MVACGGEEPGEKWWLFVVYVSRATRVMPDTQDTDIQTKEDDTKVWNLSSDIMNESLRVRKWGPYRIPLVKMSLGLI